ncbi:MAG: hypothetical protein DRO67_09920 [Candidatus Asgardarchaeum californiense]|nr:MAG: hypothetical protein DRO67_09920 [Candidatus Asgardarchaeum californiense]
MKKIIIAIFCAALMLVVPITSTALTTNVKQFPIVSNLNEDAPTIFITIEQKVKLNQFVENIADAKEKQDAMELLNTIAIPGDGYYKIDMEALANALSLIGFRPIPESELNINSILTIDEQTLNQLLDEYWGLSNGMFKNNPIGDLIQKIIEMIKGRLGWVYEFFSKAVSLFIDGATLLVDFTKQQVNVVVATTAAFVLIVNQLLATPEKVKELIGFLFDKEFQEFISTIIEFKDEFVGSCKDVITGVRSFITNFVMLDTYLAEIYTFLDWIDSNPWTEPIQITGIVKRNGIPLPGATVTCRGISVTTDTEGKFDFSVPSTPGEDSFPSNEWYGMHNCQIKVTENGEVLKETLPLLSYSFSDGTVEWTFLTIKSRSREIKEIISEILDNILLRIQHTFSTFLNNFNKEMITRNF